MTSVGDIRDVQAFNRNAVDWSPLKGYIPRGGVPSDIDGFLEINSQFLFLEAKRHGASMSIGQGIALKRLDYIHTVMVVSWKPTQDGTGKYVTRVVRPTLPDAVIARDWKELGILVERWCEWAEGRQ